MKRTLTITGWGIMSLAAVGLFLSTALYFVYALDPHYNFLGEKGDLVFDVFWRSAFYIHISGGMLSLLIGPFQFLKFIRIKKPKIHRKLGKTYIASILFTGGPAGMYMAFFANGGFVASLGFIILCLLWMISTWKALESAKNQDFNAHKNWMVRSYALTFAAVMLRIWVPVLSLGFEMEHDLVIILTAWLSWVPNIIFAETFIRIKSTYSKKAFPSFLNN